MASVASMNGAPRIAPIPISADAVPPAKTIAMSGIIVSGRAVPDRREDAADGALGEVELLPEPLDAVREQLGADEDDDEGDDERGRGGPCAQPAGGPGHDREGDHDEDGQAKRAPCARSPARAKPQVEAARRAASGVAIVAR